MFNTPLNVPMPMRPEEIDELPDEERALFIEYLRAVERLSEAMLEKLWHHRNKGRWEGIEPMTAFKLLLKEAAELLEAVVEGKKPEEVWKEAADVANFAMMMAEAHQIRLAGDDIPFEEGEYHV